MFVKPKKNFIFWKEFKQERIIANLLLLIISITLSMRFVNYRDVYKVLILFLTSYSIIFSHEVFLRDIGKNYLEAFLACPYSLKQISVEKCKYIIIKSYLFSIVATGILAIFYPGFYFNKFQFIHLVELLLLSIFIYFLICLNGLMLYKYPKFISLLFNSIIVSVAIFQLDNIYKLIIFQAIITLIILILKISKLLNIKNENLVRR